MSLNILVGNRLRNAREDLGLSQAEVGRRMKRPRSYAAVSDIERGVTSIDVETVAELAEMYGREIGYFVSGIESHQHQWVCRLCGESRP